MGTVKGVICGTEINMRPLYLKFFDAAMGAIDMVDQSTEREKLCYYTGLAEGFLRSANFIAINCPVDYDDWLSTTITGNEKSATTKCPPPC
jgi:hypothetical protein